MSKLGDSVGKVDGKAIINRHGKSHYNL